MIATRRRRPSPGLVPTDNLEHGDVAARGDAVGVVAACLHDRLLIWPVQWRAAERAGDIPITGWTDMVTLGNPRAAMVQVHGLTDVPRTGQRRLGRVSPELLVQIQRAARRHAESVQTIRRWSADREWRRDECEPSHRAL